MDHGQLIMVADKFQWVFSVTLLNTRGKDMKFCRRQRILTPFRLGLALTAICASKGVEPLPSSTAVSMPSSVRSSPTRPSISQGQASLCRFRPDQDGTAHG